MAVQVQKTALITGASNGIGLELAKLMAAKKFNLVLVARSKDKLFELKNQLVSEFGITVTVIDTDLAKTGAPEFVFKSIQDLKIKVTHLINNAGVGELNYFENSSWEKLSQILDLNIKSLTHLCHLFIPELKKLDRAYILNVSSIAAFFPGPNMAVYYASKAYVQSFTEALARELRSSSVQVKALCPGPTLSGFQDAASISADNILFKGVPTSKDVAAYAIKLLDSNAIVGVHGLKNKLLVFAVNFAPRRWLTWIVFKLQSARSK